VYDKASRII